jgi:hypothetical protein
MCSQHEWETLRRRFEDTVDDRRLRELAADVVAGVEVLVEELRSRACAPADTDWVCGRRSRSRTEWIA